MDALLGCRKAVTEVLMADLIERAPSPRFLSLFTAIDHIFLCINILA